MLKRIARRVTTLRKGWLCAQAFPIIAAGFLAEALCDDGVFSEEWSEVIREIVEYQRGALEFTLRMMDKHAESFFPVTRSRVDCCKAVLVPGVAEGPREHAYTVALAI